MKKIIAILTVFILTLFLVSCGGDSKSTPNPESDADTASDTDSEDNTDSAADTDSADPTEDPTEDPTDSTDPTEDPTDSTDPTEEPTGSVTENCNEGETRLGETVCGSTGHGKLYQVCKDGDWEDTEKCTCDPGEYPEVCGYYGQKMWFTSTSKVASIDLAEGWTRTYFHIVQEQEQDKVHIKATYCNIKIDNSMSALLQVIMPQSFSDAMGTANKESVISKRDNGTFDFFQDVFWEIRGIDPACYGDNPAGYTLPTDLYDPCVQDWDNDGVPGLTVNAKGSIGGNSTMSMVEKASSTIYDGNISEDGKRIDALVDWTDDQKILQATNNMLKGGSDNKIKNESSKFDGPANFIEQVKIEDGSDCEFIVNNAAALFSPDPVTLK